MASRFSARVLTIIAPVPRSRWLARYGIAFAAGVLAVLLRWLLDPLLGHVAFYVTVYIAVAFCAVVCGYVPAVLSALVGFFGIFYWFVDPRHSLQVIQAAQIHSIVGAILVVAVLAALGGANRSKQLRLNDTVLALVAEARERKRAQQALREAHDELERRVEARTHELSVTLAQLESEIAVRQHTEQNLRHLSLRLMNLQDEERRRIARELHDTSGQTLAAMKMSIALIRQIKNAPGALVPLLDDLDALANEALQEVRTTSYLLHPPLLDESGIASAARWFVEGFARRSGIQVECDIADKIQRPARECELVLFRVLQESLTNVHRHAAASAAYVRLTSGPDSVELEIGDNGRGIPEDDLRRFETSAEAGVGIAGMKERVRELGGHLEIRSSNGTTVSVALPVRIPSAASKNAVAV